jgi:hypothetical protein
MHSRRSNLSLLILAGTAAFSTYFCMYAFRKPFTAATFEGEELFGTSLKATLVIAQLLGYMLSKFIGIRVIAEMRREYRGRAILGLIAAAELALIGLAVVPMHIKPVMMFLNGLPLGMVFGLVLGFLEGRQLTEALSAALCASFIISSGVVKSVGRWLLTDCGIDPYQMPALTGLIFTLPLVISVKLLELTPPPDGDDVESRTERIPMSRAERRAFVQNYWPGLALLIAVYIALTIVRTIRDDFGVELWRDLGVSQAPAIFAQSETVVGLCVTLLTGLTIWVRHNVTALRLTFVLMAAAFLLSLGAAALQQAGWISPFAFMVACGVGLYLPYVAFHTTVFERLIAASRQPCNLGFLMYLADALGYLGYAGMMLSKELYGAPGAILPLFLPLLFMTAFGSMAALGLAMWYLQWKLQQVDQQVAPVVVLPLAAVPPLSGLPESGSN